MMNFTALTSGMAQAEDMVNDSMTNLFRQPGTKPGDRFQDINSEERNKSEILRMKKSVSTSIRSSKTRKLRKR